MSLRAVIYCRCSTEEESQKDALIKQVAEAKASVHQNGWILVDTYVESKSGTTTKGRSEYNRLFEDLSTNKFDIICIKSQDRLMRNTKDWYLFIDRLTTEHKKLYMYIEHKFYTTDDALITGIKAILAEEYSRELSKKLNNMHRNRQKSNGSVILTKNTYGYRKLPDKSIEVIEEEAEIKRRMYELCASGFGCRTISTILKNEGYLNRNGHPFTESAILRMIRNPLNKGTVVMNKRHYDFDLKRTLQVPEEEHFIYENKIPAIVSEELWELANQKIDERTDSRSLKKNKSRIGKNPGKDLLSGKIFCGLCGAPYYRGTHRRYKDNEIIYTWRCKTYLETGRNEGKMDRPKLRKVKLEEVEGCDNVHLDEVKLYNLLQQISEENYVSDKENIIRDMVILLKSVLEEKSYASDIEKEQHKKEAILQQMNTLVDKLLNGIISDEVYQAKQKELQEKLDFVQERMKGLEAENLKGNTIKERIAHIERILREGYIVEKATIAGMLEEVEKILIFPTYMEIHFSLTKMLGLDHCEIDGEGLDNVLRIEYGNLFCYRKQKKEEREVIVEMMKKDPSITARKIANELGISLSGANYKIRALKRDGRIRYEGKGGHGKWIVEE